MDDVPDVYSDSFLVSTGSYGAVLSFLRSSSEPSAPGSAVKSDRVATVRMSIEHLKSMTFILHRQIGDMERGEGIIVPVSHNTLNQLKIAPEDWEKFWQRED